MTTRPEESGSSDVTEDAFLGGALTILQPRAGYRAGLDAVLLAAAAPAGSGAGERVLDAGAGVGVVGLCIARRVSSARVTLIESEPRLVALARDNVVRNGLEARVEVIAADLTGRASALAAAGLASDAFEHVVANPPFHIEGRGRRPRHPIKAAAHAMPADGLDRWVRFLARVAAPGGSLTMIHRPDVLPDLLSLLVGRFGSLKVLPVHPRAGAHAVRMLVQGRKGSRAPLTLLSGLVLHRDDGGFRPEVADILRIGTALALD
ncbi:MAG: methyltransferase [Hyphomicrobiaceae bacterium]|nr:methyltransferase [Hyphomicrobiaceae bacterium]